MQCKCGASTVDRESVNKANSLRLTYCECPSCRRVRFWALYQDGVIIERGVAARDRMNEIMESESRP